MENAFKEPQTVLLLGGTSEIGQAIVDRLAGAGTRHVVLAARRPDDAAGFADRLRSRGISVDSLAFDLGQPERHAELVDEAGKLAGDLDVVVLAAGALGEPQDELDDDPVAVARLADTNVAGAMAAFTAAAASLRRQGHGRLVVLSSVAGERVRKANPAYGATKAAIDGYALGVADRLAGSGVSVLLVRPGFVRTKMTAHLPAAPMATTPAAVADAVARGLRQGRRVVWVPPLLRWVFVVFRHLPAPLWRRVPG
jgi:decaprenylphospho-beta-D-erythro-pentofuranosid-2-ulose 2-reductase